MKVRVGLPTPFLIDLHYYYCQQKNTITIKNGIAMNVLLSVHKEAGANKYISCSSLHYSSKVIIVVRTTFHKPYIRISQSSAYPIISMSHVNFWNRNRDLGINNQSRGHYNILYLTLYLYLTATRHWCQTGCSASSMEGEQGMFGQYEFPSIVRHLGTY